MLIPNSTKYELKSLIPIYYGTVYIYIHIKNIFILAVETSCRKNSENVLRNSIFSCNLFIYSNI
jgi:hypothetical protein